MKIFFCKLRDALGFHITPTTEQPKGRCVCALGLRSWAPGTSFAEKTARRNVAPEHWVFLAGTGGGVERGGLFLGMDAAGVVFRGGGSPRCGGHWAHRSVGRDADTHTPPGPRGPCALRGAGDGGPSPSAHHLPDP